jgi:MFS family permease
MRSKPAKDIQPRSPERLRGRYHGLYVMAYSVGLLLGPAIGTAVFERSETALWIACGVSGVFGAVLARIRPATVLD